MKHKRLLFGLVAGVGAGFMALASVAGAQDLTQAYYSGEQLQKGTVAGFVPDRPEQVEALKKEAITQMLGVVVSGADVPLSLSNGAPDQEVLVASQGRFEVLVSNQNGPVNRGDYITVSNLSGVGMKADDRQELVLGVALSAFQGTDDAHGTSSFKDSDGKERPVGLGRIPVDVRVASNPLFNENNKAGVPGFMARVAEVVTDEPVSALRIYMAVGAIVVTMFVAGSVVYAGTRSSIVSIGRNPLAKKSIARSMVEVALVAVVIFIIGLVAVYLLLTL